MGMKRVKFLHCADVHLDAPFSSSDTEERKSSERRQDLKLALKKIISTAGNEKVDLLLISGDLYEHDYVRKSTINFVNDCFNEIPDIKVIIVPGNHDPNTVNSYYRNFDWAKNVHILAGENSCIKFEDIRTAVFGAGFDNFYSDNAGLDNLKARLDENSEEKYRADPEGYDEEYINILLCHGTLDMNIGSDNYNPVKSEDLDKLGMDYIALGHFHNRIEAQGPRGNIFNPGSPEPLGFDEMGEHGVFVGSIVKDENSISKVDLRFVKLNSKTYEGIEVNVDGCCSDEQVRDRVLETMGEENYSDSLLDIILTGYIDREFRIDRNIIKSYIRDRVYFAKIKDNTKADYKFDEISKEPGLKGEYVRKMLLMIDEAEGENKRRLLRKALYYGMEALERGEVCI